jgi:hypothetical protein
VVSTAIEGSFIMDIENAWKAIYLEGWAIENAVESVEDEQNRLPRQ